MTPKEKAKELVDKYFEFTIHKYEDLYSIECALISVNEILFTLNEISEEDNSTYAYHTGVFYNQVKTELKKMIKSTSAGKLL